ncbi:YlxR family protein [Aquipuribacter hungaricus]|uniref:YlxR family protein n=1 Tax=Aquipuribacter hungaricus TaxID=545624 RepID=A0ABV7WEW8_9MICO
MTRRRSGPGSDRATLVEASQGGTEPSTRAQPPENPSDGPVRTCIGCRSTAPRSVLLRIVGSEVDGRPTAVPDPAAVRPGRGAWLHRDRGCLELAVRRKAAGRALRLPGAVDLSAVHLLLDEAGEPPHEERATARVQPNRKWVDEV